MNGDQQTAGESSAAEPVRLDRVERRILGVLVEKAKTTPDNYPLSIAALVTGCNQKSNRAPQMQLDEEDVESAVTALRHKHAVTVIEGSGRVPKIRHQAYDFFGVNGPQAAILTELLLRGPQTAGELRSRASRMESFGDLSAVKTVLDELIAKGHVRALSPPGRGQTFAHTFYSDEEMPKVAEAAEATSSPSKGQAQQGEIAGRVDQLERQVAELTERLERLERAIQ